jgi:hypothetical protein
MFGFDISLTPGISIETNTFLTKLVQENWFKKKGNLKPEIFPGGNL